MFTRRLFLGFILLLPLILPGLSYAQPRYENLRIQSVRALKPIESTCYNPAPGIGHYKCLQIPLVILITQASGATASISTSYKLDGQFIHQIQADFGSQTQRPLAAVHTSLQSFEVAPVLAADAALAEKLQAFARALNDFQRRIDVSKDPTDLYDYLAAQALFELTEAFLQSDALVAEKLAFLEQNQHTATALFAISQKGILNVGTSLTPFVNDARDLYELVIGRDLISGQELDAFGRSLSAIALVAGNGNTYRKAVEKLTDGLVKKSVNTALGGLPGLTYTGAGGWRSEGGIVYRKYTNRYENNLRHVLRHCSPDPSKANHTVFSVVPWDVPKLLDEAWAKKGTALADDRSDVFLVDLGRVIGTKGEKRVRLVMEKGTANLVTAYPQP